MPFLKKMFCGAEPPSSSGPHSLFTGSDKCELKNSDGSDETLCSSTTRYFVQTVAGEGRFGVVSKGVNLMTSEDVAIKFLKSDQTAERESKMLELVSVLDPVKNNLVKFFEMFKYDEQTCLVFEVLDRDLFHLMAEQSLESLPLHEIRPITQQLLTAFDALKGIGVVHADLKPSNIMVTNHPSEPFRVKLIDFGLSFTTSERIMGNIQPLGYRAPEVMLGLPISEAIDVWGLGCVLLFLFLGKHPFSIHCEYKAMRDIVLAVEKPGDHLLSAGKFTYKFFKENQLWENPKWWFKTPSEYQLSTGNQPKAWKQVFSNLDCLVTYDPDIHEQPELDDQRAFVSLLKCLLQTDPEKRITPGKALTHPFVTVAHLKDKTDCSYVRDSFERMVICQKHDVEEKLFPGGEVEEAQGEDPSVITQSNKAESSSSFEIEIVCHSSNGRQVAEGSAVCEDVAVPTEEPSTSSTSPDKGPNTNVRRRRLKAVRESFSRAMRTLFRMNKR